MLHFEFVVQYRLYMVICIPCIMLMKVIRSMSKHDWVVMQKHGYNGIDTEIKRYTSKELRTAVQ